MNICYILPFTLSPEQLFCIEQRLAEFKALKNADNAAWFSELCFCILTANAQARKAIAIQQAVGPEGFLCMSEQELAALIKSYGHRFHNTKARYIIQARAYTCIKTLLKNMTGPEARNFLVRHIKGLGYKEASHFLRNVGYSDVAIIDRHILKFLVRYNFITHVPTTLTPKYYCILEEQLKNFHIPLDKLDLMIWYFMTGVILK